jgi:hypothetical protein
VLLALGPTFLLQSPLTLEVALGFVAVQVLIEYAGSGYSKATAWRTWVRGPSLLQVLASSNYGHPRAAAFVESHPVAGGVLASGVIALEIAAPVSLILPTPISESLLLGLLAFHLGAATLIGLNTFVWAFAATYPAILHCRNLLLYP